jgi:hypothetical protein
MNPLASLDMTLRGTIVFLLQHFQLDQLVADATNTFANILVECLKRGLWQHARIIVMRHVSKSRFYNG